MKCPECKQEMQDAGTYWYCYNPDCDNFSIDKEHKHQFWREDLKECHNPRYGC